MVSEQRRFVISFVILLALAAIANVQVIMRSGSFLGCGGIESRSVRFACERWQSIGVIVTAIVPLYPIAYLFETERDVRIFAE